MITGRPVNLTYLIIDWENCLESELPKDLRFDNEVVLQKVLEMVWAF